MSNVMVTLVVLTGFAALAGLFLYLTIRDGDRWRRKLDAALVPIGFRPVEKTGMEPLEKRLRITHPRHAGKRLLMHLYRRPSPGGDCQVYVCDYRFSSASGKAAGAAWLPVGLVSDSLALPRLHIEGVPTLPGWAQAFHGALAGAMEIPGAKRLMTGDEDFDRRYRIFYFGSGAAPALPPALMTVLGDTPGGIGVDMEGDTLFLTSIEMLADRVRQEFDPKKLLGLVHLAARLHESLRVSSG